MPGLLASGSVPTTSDGASEEGWTDTSWQPETTRASAAPETVREKDRVEIISSPMFLGWKGTSVRASSLSEPGYHRSLGLSYVEG
jgi:hypothetical protein